MQFSPSFVCVVITFKLNNYANEYYLWEKWEADLFEQEPSLGSRLLQR